MAAKPLRIGIVAPASRIDHALADRVNAIAAAQYGDRVELVFHPQCYLTSGHFAGDDAARAAAFVEVANDPSFEVVWFARGGYGACRLLDLIMPRLTKAAFDKMYVGYSDTGSLLGPLYAKRARSVVHGPMPADIKRSGGETAVKRALGYIVEQAAEAIEPSVASIGSPVAAFNITILSHLLGTPFEPNLEGHVLLLEDVSEPMYRIDRSLFHVTSNPRIRKVAGIRLGRCVDITPNDPDFGEDEVAVMERWCARAGIPYLGRADIGHDVENKVVPFGPWRGA
ncbi:MAG: LD-carboxypeptidase [Alphaproteobacteria bacterium]|nr:LD-carboxypeptidase [Alphaproteobacteria bacterium]